jgi:anti-sigma regulatory factor (Ser/Thr protein kinase)
MSSGYDAPHLPAHVLVEQTHLRLPSYPHWIDATVDYLRQKAVLAGACQESRSGKLMVALHEALSNAIVHGNLEVSSELKELGDDAFARTLAERAADPRYAERYVDILVDSDAERCRWVVTDQGPGFDVAAVLMRKLSDDPEVVLASGRGILIMRSFLDEVRYELGGRRLILTLQRTSGIEKRQVPRVPMTQPLRIAPILSDGSVDWDAAYQAVSRNLSPGGVSVLQERLAGSDRIVIGMVVDNEMVYVPAKVKHCRSLAGDVVELGCRFQTSGEDEQPASPRRRASARRSAPCWRPTASRRRPAIAAPSSAWYSLSGSTSLFRARTGRSPLMRATFRAAAWRSSPRSRSQAKSRSSSLRRTAGHRCASPARWSAA